MFHVVVEPNESTAEFYTHDLKLLDSWSLGEGRKRHHREDEFDIPIEEPTPTPHELRMKLDAMRFRNEVNEERAQYAEKQVQLLKQELEQEKAKGAGKNEQAGSKSKKRKR